jgi:hypothetical protein
MKKISTLQAFVRPIARATKQSAKNVHSWEQCVLRSGKSRLSFAIPEHLFRNHPNRPEPGFHQLGHPVIGNFVRRSPNACPPCAHKCISAKTPAFFSAK